MRLLANSIVVSMCLALSSGAAAQQSAEMTVAGSVFASACGFSQFRDVDFGKIPAKSLNGDEQTTPELSQAQVFDLRIECSSPTKYSIEVTDNRSAFVVDGAIPVPHLDASYHFGLGAGQAGNFVLEAAGNSDDSSAPFYLDLLISADGGATWTPNAPQVAYIKPGALNRIAFTWDNVMIPRPLKRSTFSGFVLPAIRKTSSLDLSNPIELDGSIVFTLHYE